MQMMATEDGRAVAVIHFIVPKGRGWVLACAPHLTNLSSQPGQPFPMLRSEDARTTTCRLCKGTEAWARAFAEAPKIAGRAYAGG